MRHLFFFIPLCAASLLLMGCGGSKKAPTSDGAPAAPRPKLQFATIGTGGISGVYYPTGGNIADMVNKQSEKYRIRCTHESTGGSKFNVNAMLAGDLEFGIVQSDIQYQAYHGKGEWKDKGPQNSLRAVFSIHPELVTLVAASDSGINSVSDLKGKRVNIGNPGSGQRLNAMDVLSNAGLNHESDLKAESVAAAQAPGLLQDGRIDAFFYTVGHPSGAIKEASAGRRKVRFVPITGVEKLLKESPYYVVANIPVQNYPQSDSKSDVVTFGVKATFMTTDKVSDDTVYAVTREVFENFDAFIKLHPAYAQLTKESMLQGLSAPFHPGAERYYREVGLLK